MTNTLQRAPRAYRRYKGVAIYRITTPLTGVTFHENGKPRKPKKDEIQVAYAFAGGYPCDTVNEVKEMIDNIFKKCKDRSIDDEIIIKIMNSDD